MLHLIYCVASWQPFDFETPGHKNSKLDTLELTGYGICVACDMIMVIVAARFCAVIMDVLWCDVLLGMLRLGILPAWVMY